MPVTITSRLIVGMVAFALHALAMVWLSSFTHQSTVARTKVAHQETIVYLKALPVAKRTRQPKARSLPAKVEKTPATMAAPPAPSAQEWAFAAKYTLKNSKGYRYNWGQQVRSMMGTAVEGADQGIVRFRVEIAPSGVLAKLETIWSTSKTAEKLARMAIEKMPTLPPTPTGKPLIFERTISFSPFASDGPPVYRDDCLPDVPGFRNPFAWDGKAPQVIAPPQPVEKPDPQAMEECLKHLPQESIEAEEAEDKRQMKRWGTGKIKN